MRNLLLIILAVVALAGCTTAPEQVKDDMEFAYKAWEEDKRPTLGNDDYAALTEEQRKPYMPESRDRARRAFFAQAIKTAGTATGE
jgi:hypothetical protein